MVNLKSFIEQTDTEVGLPEDTLKYILRMCQLRLDAFFIYTDEEKYTTLPKSLYFIREDNGVKICRGKGHMMLGIALSHNKSQLNMKTVFVTTKKRCKKDIDGESVMTQVKQTENLSAISKYKQDTLRIYLNKKYIATYMEVLNNEQ